MSQCPFWSINGEKFICYSDCPMYVGSKDNEVCPFKEFAAAKTISLKDVDSYRYEEDLSYFNLPRISVYK
ncbi:MAG: hypothetical protein ABRQ25_06560 [Clostridiaceae bacterium]